MIVWTPAVLGVLYASVLYFCICTCSSQFSMERRSRNTIIIIIIIIIIISIIIMLGQRRSSPAAHAGHRLSMPGPVSGQH